MKQEVNIEQRFFTKLKEAGYSDSVILREVRIDGQVWDFAIKNGDRYVQVFELKAASKPYARRRFFQYVDELKISLPVYYVVAEKDGSFSYYEKGNNTQLNERDVLSFKKATEEFVDSAERALKNNNRSKFVIFIIILLCLGGSYVVYFCHSLCEVEYIYPALILAALAILTACIPFLSHFKFSVKDWGLDFTFSDKN